MHRRVNALENLLEQRAKLTASIAAMRMEVSLERAKRREETKKRGTEEQRVLVRRVLDGESVTEVAMGVNRTPSCVRQHLQRLCRNADPALYEAGILSGSTNNYCTPPLKYLRENKRAFGF